MRLALAQMNSVVGDLEGNRERILARLREAHALEADLVVFPELAVTGYPPEDLLLRPAFVRASMSVVSELALQTQETPGLVAVLGAPYFDVDLYNGAYVLEDGAVKAVWRKRFLPNYGVFDEDRYFASGHDSFLLRLGEALVGLTVCEDIWQPGPPATELALSGAQMIVNISASPFHVGKAEAREAMLVQRARDNSAFVAFCNLVGAQDELVFDGHSVVLDDDGRVLARAPGFEEALLLVDVEPEEAMGRRLRDGRARALKRVQPSRAEVVELAKPKKADKGPLPPPVTTPHEPELEQMYLALCQGLGDYILKNGFRDVVVGVSGGVDSALTAAICVDVLGPERVHCVSMPSRYSSAETRQDAKLLAEALGADYLELPIEGVVSEFTDVLAAPFAGHEPGVAEENVQARTRGVLLMALSNKFSWLVVSTGNKSEYAVGYATLYGDMVGGFALLKDVYKTDVFRLARHVNERAGRELIPATTIERAPSAELREDQRDDQYLPPYAELDPLLDAYVEQDLSRHELVEEGFDEDLVSRVIAMVDRAEYKRRQAAPGVKLRPKAFGRDRRTPITNRWRQ